MTTQPAVTVALIAALPPTIAAVLSFLQARLTQRSSNGTAVAVEHLRAAVDDVRAGLQRVEVSVAELHGRVTQLEGRPRRGRRRYAARRP